MKCYRNGCSHVGKMIPTIHYTSICACLSIHVINQHLTHDAGKVDVRNYPLSIGFRVSVYMLPAANDPKE